MAVVSPLRHFGAGDSDMRIDGWPYDRPEYTSLFAAVQGETSRWNVPGVAVGVLRDGEIETVAAGFGNIFTRMPLTEDAILQIGSISKVYTATLAMILVDEGLLDLDEPVVTYLPDLTLADEDAQRTVTLRHLLSHTSGIEGDRFLDYGMGEDSLEKAIAEFDTLRQWFVPGDLWSYSNAGFYLACRVIEKVSGKPFDTVFREKLIDPLGVKTAFFRAQDVITYPHAVGHYLKSREEGHSLAHGYSFPRHINGTGAVVTSTRELLRFGQLHLGEGEIDGKRLLSSKLALEMREPIAEAGDFYRNYGIGWCVHEYPEFRTISHGGATMGFRANLMVVPDKDFAIAILTNGDAGSRAIQEIEAWALKHYLEFERPTPSRVKRTGKQLAELAGTYTRHDGESTVAVVDDRLELKVAHINEENGEVEGEDTYPLIAVGELRYRIPDGPAKNAIVDFIEYTGNGRKQLYIRMGGRLSERAADDAKSAKAPAGKSAAKGKSKAPAGKSAPRGKKK